MSIVRNAPDEGRSFADRHPKVAAEWDFGKNPDGPYDLKPRSNVERWFVCPREHSYLALLSNRAVGSGCTECGRQTSAIESSLYFAIALRHTVSPPQTRIKTGPGQPLWPDIYIPSLGIVVEYDGWYWHRDREAIDMSKNARYAGIGLDVLRVRERPLGELGLHSILVDQGHLQVSEDVLSATLNAIDRIAFDNKTHQRSG